MRRDGSWRFAWLVISGGALLCMLVSAFFAPEFLSTPDLSARELGPLAAPPFGTDTMGIPLTEYALQGAKVVTVPSVIAGLLVMYMATIGGLARCADLSWLDGALQVFSEVMGAIPRLVVILVVAVMVTGGAVDQMLSWTPHLPKVLVFVGWLWTAIRVPLQYLVHAYPLVPIALTWAVLASPGAMDEAATTAHRLGGARFVEALRAHGFTARRIYLYHIVWLNLRSVIVRQGAEVMMQVVFLEIALSYLAVSQQRPALTHGDNVHSWASLLYDGYTWLVASQPLAHSLVLGLALVAVTAVMAQGLRLAARER